jgi:hypothetical protein
MDQFKDQRGTPYKSDKRRCEADNFRRIDGRWIAMSGRIVNTIVPADGPNITETLSVERQNVMFDPDFSKLGAFAVNIPDGVRILLSQAYLTNGVIFEWRKGKIVPQVDEDSLRRALNDLSGAPLVDAASDARAGAGIWFLVLGFGAVVIVIPLAIVFARKKRVEDQKAVVAR